MTTRQMGRYNGHTVTMSKKKMVLYHDGHIQREFIELCALQNLRRLFGELLGEERPRAQSHADLIAQVEEHHLACPVNDFIESLWKFFDLDTRGHYHIMTLSAKIWRERISVDEAVSQPLEMMKKISEEKREIHSGEVASVRVIDENTFHYEILFIAETEAEIRTPDHDPDETTIQGERYVFKAYRVVQVPMVCKITIATNQVPQIAGLPVIANGNPRLGLLATQKWMTQKFGCSFPPREVKSGVSQLLQDGRLIPVSMIVEEPDGTKIRYQRAPSLQNASSQEVEAVIKQWHPHGGFVRLDEKYNFRVDVGRAIFSFNKNIAYEEACNVIQTVLGSCL